jgi:sulfite reductase (ferredoxin)
MFMIRLKLPGGKLTADQYLALDEVAGKYANGTLRATTRQSIQFHGVLKSDLKATLAGFHAALMTSLGGCGDVNRNVMACPAPTGDPVRVECQRLADEVAAHLAPRAGARTYHEIWLDGEPQEFPAAEHENPETFEPIYGKHYLPRKFKIAFALPHDNCTDLLAQCLGFLAVGGGYDLYAGGGQGLTNSKPDTYACLAQPVGFIHAGEVVAASEAIAKLYRDHGNRSDRKRARLKYVMHDWGVEKFRDVFYRDYFTGPRRPPTGTPITGLDLHHGWQPQADGRWFLGLSVENGRVKDEGELRLRTALREIVKRVRCDVRLSAQQDVMLCGIGTADRTVVDDLLSQHGVPRAEALSLVQKWSMACPAIPTCSVAISESERALPGIIDQLEATLAELGLGGEPISVRMTGCPNGCARPYQSEVGIVGRSGDKYTLYVGGDSFGRRLNSELADLVPRGDIVPKLRAVFGAFRDERQDAETFGAYCERVGLERLKAATAV